MEIRRPRDDEHERVADRLLWPAFEEAAANDPEFSALSDDAREVAGDVEYWTGDGDRAIFVAERDGALVGNVSGFFKESAPLYARGPTAYCDGLYVRPDHRREGIASALMDRFEEWGRDRDCEYVGLSVHPDREAAVAFYESREYETKFLSKRREL